MEISSGHSRPLTPEYRLSTPEIPHSTTYKKLCTDRRHHRSSTIMDKILEVINEEE